MSVSTISQVGVGAKHDSGKLRFSLFPIMALNPMLRVLEFGARKYAPHTWRTIPDAKTRYADSLHRHYVEHLEGKEFDDESGEPVLAHLAINAVFLLGMYVIEKAATKESAHVSP